MYDCPCFSLWGHSLTYFSPVPCGIKQIPQRPQGLVPMGSSLGPSIVSGNQLVRKFIPWGHLFFNRIEKDLCMRKILTCWVLRLLLRRFPHSGQQTLLTWTKQVGSTLPLVLLPSDHCAPSNQHLRSVESPPPLVYRHRSCQEFLQESLSLSPAKAFTTINKFCALLLLNDVM